MSAIRLMAVMVKIMFEVMVISIHVNKTSYMWGDQQKPYKPNALKHMLPSSSKLANLWIPCIKCHCIIFIFIRATEAFHQFRIQLGSIMLVSPQTRIICQSAEIICQGCRGPSKNVLQLIKRKRLIIWKGSAKSNCTPAAIQSI